MAGSNGVKVNLGSGPTANPGWVCIDRSPNIVLSRHPAVKRALRRVGVLNDGHMAHWDSDVRYGDVRRLEFLDHSVDAIYSSHMLEHIYLADVRCVLSEARRVLRVGGIIRLALPDVTTLAAELLAGEDAGDSGAGHRFNLALLAHPDSPPRGFRTVLGIAGGHIHRWQPTPAMVSAMLEDAGFHDVRRLPFREGDLPDLARVETRSEGFHLEARG